MKRIIALVLIAGFGCTLQKVRQECRQQCAHLRGSSFPATVPPKIWDECMRDCEARDGAPPTEETEGNTP